MLLLPRLLTVMMKCLIRVAHAILLCFRVLVMLQFLARTPVFLTFSLCHPPLFAPDLPRRLAAGALSGMVNTNLSLLLLHPLAAGEAS
jgi:hypothetical protein